MGDDTSIVQAASFLWQGYKKVSTDSGLIKYLMRHWHSTPFENVANSIMLNFQFLLHVNGLDIEQLM